MELSKSAMAVIRESEAVVHRVSRVMRRDGHTPRQMLGVASDASHSQCRRAYFKLSRLLHPDRLGAAFGLGNVPPRFVDAFHAIADAHASLQDSRAGSTAAPPPPTAATPPAGADFSVAAPVVGAATGPASEPPGSGPLCSSGGGGCGASGDTPMARDSMTSGASRARDSMTSSDTPMARDGMTSGASTARDSKTSAVQEAKESDAAQAEECSARASPDRVEASSVAMVTVADDRLELAEYSGMVAALHDEHLGMFAMHSRGAEHKSNINRDPSKYSKGDRLRRHQRGQRQRAGQRKRAARRLQQHGFSFKPVSRRKQQQLQVLKAGMSRAAGVQATPAAPVAVALLQDGTLGAIL